MIRFLDKSSCNGCSACAMVCPKGCISMEPDAWGFRYPKIDTERCINCGLCEKVCPVMTERPIQTETKAYSACNMSDSVRLSSSSGGVFTILAEYVISRGGVVFGAVFDENWDVVHAFAESIPELDKFRGAKYVQSYVGNSYQKAKAFLEDGRDVLFSGTPCQIGGLKAYLGKEYENLICQDMICHGVPAPGIWRKYLKELEGKAGAPARTVSFRCKMRGWKNYVMSIVFKNGKAYQKIPVLDPYMRAFLSDLSLRPSCFECKHKGISRQADITLADFWGIEQVQPQMDDNKGTSLILIHSEKGKNLLRVMEGKAIVQTINLDEAIRHNPSAIKSASMPHNYSGFMKAVNAESLTQTVERNNKIPIVLRMKLEMFESLQRIRDWRAEKS